MGFSILLRYSLQARFLLCVPMCQSSDQRLTALLLHHSRSSPPLLKRLSRGCVYWGSKRRIISLWRSLLHSHCQIHDHVLSHSVVCCSQGQSSRCTISFAQLRKWSTATSHYYRSCVSAGPRDQDDSQPLPQWTCTFSGVHRDHDLLLLETVPLQPTCRTIAQSPIDFPFCQKLLFHQSCPSDSQQLLVLFVPPQFAVPQTLTGCENRTEGLLPLVFQIVRICWF